MKIYTKFGDSGTTRKYSGERLPKSDELFDVLGTFDELNVHIGMILHCFPNSNELTELQKTNIRICSELATSETCPRFKNVAVKNLDTKKLETSIDEMTLELPPLTVFLLIGPSFENALIHQCRTTCRRLERKLVGLGARPEFLQYINRLSDYFFTLARYYAAQNEEKEIEMS